MNLEHIDNPAATQSQLRAAEQELIQRLLDLDTQGEVVKLKAIELAKRSMDINVAGELVASQGGIEMLKNGAQAALEDVRRKIVLLEEKDLRETKKRQWTSVRALLDKRNTAIDEAEAAIAEAARCIQTALDHTQQALLAAPEKRDVNIVSSIREGMDLIPALTERFWLQLGFKHPMIPTMDNLYARKVGPLSKIFAFECNLIDLEVKS